MEIIKSFMKAILSILYNPVAIIRMGKIRYPFYIGKNLLIKNPANVSLGKNVTIFRNGRLSSYGNHKNNIVIADNCYIGQYFSALSYADLKIGKNTLIASFVAIISENHSVDPLCGISYGKQPLIGKTTIIGENCWIGEKVVILPGVTIGDWCIIGAGSIVTKDIPSYCIACGNPAKIIKEYDFIQKKWISYDKSEK